MSRESAVHYKHTTMAEEDNNSNPTKPRLSNHIKVIYFLIFVLFLATTASFVVNFLYILEIREDLLTKCSCPDGERLLSLELHVEGVAPVDGSRSGDSRYDGGGNMGDISRPHPGPFRTYKGTMSSDETAETSQRRVQHQKGSGSTQVHHGNNDGILLDNPQDDIDGGGDERDRRKTSSDSRANNRRLENTFYHNSGVIEAYAKLPVTISVGSVLYG